MKMAQEVENTNPRNQIPDHLRGFTKAKIGNVDVTDLVIPRVKLLQALSPELTEFDNAKVGSFWHTIASENMGEELLAIPIVIKKSYVLWSPRNDERGILARAMDGIHWDQPNAEFTVKPKGSPSSVTYKLAATVAESGLDLFGSSIPGDPQSVPAASLTYNMLWFFPEFQELSPSVIINTRSSIKPMQQLLSKIDAKPVAHFVQMYKIGIVQARGAEGPYFNYTYTSDGFADAETAKLTESLYNRFSDAKWQANEETADVEDSGNGGGRARKETTAEDDSKY
jgi:hypothetical protein